MELRDILNALLGLGALVTGIVTIWFQRGQDLRFQQRAKRQLELSDILKERGAPTGHDLSKNHLAAHDKLVVDLDREGRANAVLLLTRAGSPSPSFPWQTARQRKTASLGSP